MAENPRGRNDPDKVVGPVVIRAANCLMQPELEKLLLAVIEVDYNNSKKYEMLLSGINNKDFITEKDIEDIIYVIDKLAIQGIKNTTITKLKNMAISLPKCTSNDKQKK